MPDENGRLSQEDKVKIIAWLEEKGQANCPVCQNENWVLADHIVTGIPIGAGLNLGGAAYPQIIVACTNCFYSRHFMAVPMGVMQSKDAEDTKASSEKDDAPV